MVSTDYRSEDFYDPPPGMEKRGKKREIISPLVQKGADLNARTPKGLTPLYFGGGDPVILRQLLQSGADPKRASAHGGKIMRDLTRFKDLDAMRELLDSGLDFLHQDPSGNTFAHSAAAEFLPATVMTFLHERGVPLHTANAQGFTPLHLAAWDFPEVGFSR